MRNIITLFIISMAVSVYAQLPYNESFESITTANTLPVGMASTSLGTNCITSISPSTYNRMPHGGTDFASFKYGSNDWFFTSGLALTAGVTYQFSVWYVTDGATGFTFEAKYGLSQTSAAMTGTISGAIVSNPTNTTYSQMTGTFTPASTATYYIGLHGTANFNPWYLSFDDIEVKTAAVNMSYVSCTTTQANTANVAKGSTNNQIIGMEIVTAGTLNPLSVSSYTFNTTGSTAANTDIASARLWTTGTSPVFATTTPLGSAVILPNGTFTINLGINMPYGLSEGINYFWLTYDIPAGAIVSHLVDAGCTQIIVGGTMRTPGVTAPTGNRPVSATPPPVNCDSYDGSFTVSTAGYMSTGTYHQEYALVNSSSNIIVAVNNTGIFSGASIGGYYIYALNYEGLRPAQLAVGNSWATVTAYDAVPSNCIDLTGAYLGRIVYVCNTDTICEPNSINVQVKNNNNGAGYFTYYVLVRGATIIAANTTGIFNQATYLIDGLYNIYAVNTNNASVIAEIANLGPWADIQALQTSCCMDILGPRAYFISDISVASCSILPVELVMFESQCEGDGNIIRWETVSEKNNAYFTLEKSINNSDFFPLVNIPGAGNSNETKTYSYIDQQNEWEVLYRLKQTDFDGTGNYSGVIGSAPCDKAEEGWAIQVYDQQNGRIAIAFTDELEETTRVLVNNNLGQLIFSGFAEKGSRQYLIPRTVFLNRSIYFFNLSNSKRSISIKQVL